MVRAAVLGRMSPEERVLVEDMRDWLLTCAGINTAVMERLMDTLDEEEVDSLDDLRILASRAGGKFDTRLTVTTAGKIRAALQETTPPMRRRGAPPTPPPPPEPLPEPPLPESADDAAQDEPTQALPSPPPAPPPASPTASTITSAITSATVTAAESSSAITTAEPSATLVDLRG